MDIMNLINYFVKATQQIIVYEPDKITPQYLGSGSLLQYKDRVFLITAAHVTDHDGLETAIETGQDPVNDETPIYNVGALNYVDSYKVDNLDELKDIQELKDLLDEKNMIETLDFTFVEMTEQVKLLQKEMDFGEYYGKVDAGEKIMLTQHDLDHTPDPEVGYSFYGTIKAEIVGKYLKRQPKLTLGIEYVRATGRFHVFKLAEDISDAREFRGTSGAPIFDDEGRFVGIVTHCFEGQPYIYGFTSQEIKKHLDAYLETPADEDGKE